MRKQGYKINRFPICSIVHFAVAERLGYPTHQAMALGEASAIFYAAAKYGYFNRGGSRKSKKGKTSSLPAEIKSTLRLGDRIFYATERNGTLYPTMGGQVITEENFMKTLRSKLNDEEIKAIINFARKYVSDLPEHTLHRPYNIYIRVRDEWRTHEFWEKLMSEYKEQAA